MLSRISDTERSDSSTWLWAVNVILSRISDTGKLNMALHLVGETIDKNRSHYGAETGKLVQLMRGIYVDAVDDVDATVLRHAVRIARYLYPHTYLAAASALLLGPTRDGRLFI